MTLSRLLADFVERMASVHEERRVVRRVLAEEAHDLGCRNGCPGPSTSTASSATHSCRRCRGGCLFLIISNPKAAPRIRHDLRRHDFLTKRVDLQGCTGASPTPSEKRQDCEKLHFEPSWVPHGTTRSTKSVSDEKDSLAETMMQLLTRCLGP